MKAQLLLLLVAAAAASAFITPPPAPLCDQYLLSDQNLGSTPNFTANVLFYNQQNLKSGTPLGPWFSLVPGPNCYFAPNTSLACNLILFQDANRQQQIGTGSISAVGTLFEQNGFIGGSATLTTVINPALVTINPSPAVNFQSQTTTIYFGPSQMYPVDLSQPAVANKALYSSDLQSGVLTLWGSNGWNGQTYTSSRTTGLDFRATMSCAPSPIIPPCNPAPGSTFTAPYACAQAGIVVRFHSSTSDIALSFSSGSSATGCSNF